VGNAGGQPAQVVGIVGILVFYVGLDVLFGLIAPDAEAVLPYILRYIRYALVGAWVSAGAPWTFVRLKLSGSITNFPAGIRL
jgi:uncharacterized membrane protein YGL010W